MSKVLILQPVAKARHPLNQRFLDELRRSPAFQIDGVIELVGCSDIVEARNRLVDMAIERFSVHSNVSHVFWLDADIVGSVDTFVRHLALCEKIQAPLAGTYLRRGGNTSVLTRVTWGQGRDNQGFKRVVGGMGALLVPRSDFIRRHELGPVMVNSSFRRHCFLPSTLREEGGLRYVSEDHAYTLGFYLSGFHCEGVWESIAEPLFYGHVTERVEYPETSDEWKGVSES